MVNPIRCLRCEEDVTDAADHVCEDLKELTKDDLDAKRTCPNCGEPIRPYTNAERQKRWREKKK